MSNFEALLPLILKHEGGFVNHPSDPGGATNKGVTIGTYRAYVDPNGTVEDLKALTDAQAGKVYRAQYWDAVEADSLPRGVDYAVFDFAVNSGPGRAVKYLQDIVGVPQDGVIGPMTLAAVERAPSTAVIDELCDQRLAFMRRIRGGKLWATFGRGWQRRVDEVRAISLEMAGEVPPQIFDNEPDPAPVPDWVADPAPGRIHKPPAEVTMTRAELDAIARSLDESDDEGSSTLQRTLGTKIRSFLAGGGGVGALGYIGGAWDAFTALPATTQAVIGAVIALVVFIAWTEFRSASANEASRRRKGDEAKAGKLALGAALDRAGL